MSIAKKPEGAASVDVQGLSPRDLAQISWGGRGRADGPVIDCSVHPRPTQGELRRFMPPLWRDRRLPMGERYYYPNPVGDYLKDSYPDSGPPGSDAALVSRHLFDEAGVEAAILLPLTLGLLPDPDLQAAICSATNAWLAETWLGPFNAHGRFRASIRVAPANPAAAVAEIEKWAGHPMVAQVAVPMQSMQLYGDPRFMPIWRAAAEAKLPVALHTEAESGVELAPTTLGYFRQFVAYAAYQPTTFINHLTNMMAGGVLDALPDLRLVFADGAWDIATPFLWRLDKDYRPMRPDMPWMTRLPSDYIAHHVRFVAHALEGPEDPALLEEWLGICDGGRTVIFGSNYPHWNIHHPAEAFAGIDAALRRRVMAETAAGLYRITLPATAREEAGA
jgi:predicted TIM-barrel fold metal-dependent hydrolase